MYIYKYMYIFIYIYVYLYIGGGRGGEGWGREGNLQVHLQITRVPRPASFGLLRLLRPPSAALCPRRPSADTPTPIENYIKTCATNVFLRMTIIIFTHTHHTLTCMLVWQHVCSCRRTFFDTEKSCEMEKQCNMTINFSKTYMFTKN